MSYIKNDEMVFIAGMTGSGKSFLTQYYTSNNTKLTCILDTKGTFEWQHVLKSDKIIINDFNKLQNSIYDYNRIIYRPKRENLNIEHYNEFFEFFYFLKNNTVVVDEVMQVCPSSIKMPEFYKGILTRGRELDVNIWSCTQRPSSIPVVVYSEATHWFIFKLNSLTDRKKMADFTGFDELKESIEKKVFWYYNANESEQPEKGILKIGGGSNGG